MLKQSDKNQVFTLRRKRANIEPEKCSLCAGKELTPSQAGVHFAPGKRSLCAGFLTTRIHEKGCSLCSGKSIRFCPDLGVHFHRILVSSLRRIMQL